MVLYNGMLSMSRRPLQEGRTIDSISIVSLSSRVGQEKILDENRNRPDGIPSVNYTKGKISRPA